MVEKDTDGILFTSINGRIKTIALSVLQNRILLQFSLIRIKYMKPMGGGGGVIMLIHNKANYKPIQFDQKRKYDTLS